MTQSTVMLTVAIAALLVALGTLAGTVTFLRAGQRRADDSPCIATMRRDPTNPTPGAGAVERDDRRTTAVGLEPHWASGRRLVVQGAPDRWQARPTRLRDPAPSQRWRDSTAD